MSVAKLVIRIEIEGYQQWTPNNRRYHDLGTEYPTSYIEENICGIIEQFGQWDRFHWRCNGPTTHTRTRTVENKKENEHLKDLDIMDNQNFWDKVEPLNTDKIIELVNTSTSRKQPITDWRTAIDALHTICLIVKALDTIERHEPNLKDCDHTDVANIVDRYVDEHKLASPWRQGLFEPVCALVRTLRRGETPWYRGDTPCEQ